MKKTFGIHLVLALIGIVYICGPAMAEDPHFKYKDGPEDRGIFNLPRYYELVEDYTINLNEYFSVLDNLPGNHALGLWNGTEREREMLVYHINHMWPTIKWDFIGFEDGYLTVKKGYRWDGASIPTNTWINLAVNPE